MEISKAQGEHHNAYKIPELRFGMTLGKVSMY